MVEFVLVLPMLVLVLFAIVDFGMSMNYWNDLNHVASAGARKAAVTGNKPVDLAAYVCDQAEPVMKNEGEVEVTLSMPDGTGAGQRVVVEATATHSMVHTIPGLAGLTEMTMKGDATMRLEAPAGFTASSWSCP